MWEQYFREYVVNPYGHWPAGRTRQADKLARHFESKTFDQIISLAHLRAKERPLTLFIVNCGSSGSHWLGSMLNELPFIADCGEVYLPPRLMDEMQEWMPEQRSSMIDAIHLVHSDLTSVGDSTILLNSAHDADLATPIAMGSTARTVLLIRDPMDIVLSRTLRKGEYKKSIAPDMSKADYLHFNIEFVRRFFSRIQQHAHDNVVRYENLRETPEMVLEDFCRTLDLDGSDFGKIVSRHPVGGFTSNRPKEPQEELSADLEQEAAAALKSVRQIWGYLEESKRRPSPAPGHELFASPRSEEALNPSRILVDVPNLHEARRRVGAWDDGTIELRGVDLNVRDGEIEWTDSEGRGRSFQRLLHGHLPVRDLAVLAADGDRGAAGCAMSIVRSWWRTNGDEERAEPMAWHDETTAQRLLSWVALDDSLRRLGWAPLELADLSSMSVEHVRLLLDSDFHAAGTNHGMFQDRAILAWAHSPLGASSHLASDASKTAQSRLIEYLNSCVLPDGVHREHSPAYHQLVAAEADRYARFFSATGATRPATALSRLHRSMLRYATHVIQPNGTFPLIGDTFSYNRPVLRVFGDDSAYSFAVSVGERGEAPVDRTAVFPNSGYAIMRSDWLEGSRGTYLHFGAAYHTNYHKHADDLSLWVYHEGELLTEAGPNGYEYEDPFTKLGYSALGHNVVLVDGEGVPRVDGNTSAVGLIDWGDDGMVSTVRGRTLRLPGTVHERSVFYGREDGTVIVSDDLKAEQPRIFTLLWHVAPQVDVKKSASDIELYRHGRLVARLAVQSGEEPVVPELVVADAEARGGWRLGGGDPEPTATLKYHIRGETVTLVTTIKLEKARDQATEKRSDLPTKA